jgi:Zn-finger protein
MRFVAVVFIFTSLSVLAQEHNQLSSPCSSNEEQQAFCFATYLQMLSEATQKYFQKHSDEPILICKKCNKHKLPISEFSGGLIGKTLKDLADKNDFTAMKRIFEAFIKLLSSDTGMLIISDFIHREINSIGYHCPICHECFWGKI